MHDGTQYDQIQGHIKVMCPSAIFNSYFFRHLQRELATDNGFLN